MFELDKKYLTVTPKLKEHWLKAVNDSHDGIWATFVRGGCSGDELKFELLEKDHDKTDNYILLDDSTKLYIDQKVMHVFSGGTLDLVQDGIGEVVKLNGPNLGAGCGCGQSYNIGNP